MSDLDFDVLVKSIDPGATLLFEKRYNNINRILTTTIAGLEKISRPFCAKIRSDLYFDNDKPLAFANDFQKRNSALSIFKQRIVFYHLWSRKSKNLMNKFPILYPWYLSDWLCFGLTEDIKNYFKASSFTNEPEFSNYFSNPQNRLHGFFDSYVKWKFPPEQYFCTSFFKQYFKEADMLNSQDYSEEKSQKSREILANNIIIGSYDETGCFILKKNHYLVSKFFSKFCTENGIFTYSDFLSDYKKYCDPDFIMPFKYRWKQDLKIQKYMARYKKYFLRFMLSIKAFLRWVNDLLAIPYYALRIALNILWYAPRTIYHEIRRRLS